MSRLDTALVVRFGAIAFAVIAVGLGAVQLDRDGGRDEGGVRVVTIAPEDAADPLAAELSRCRAITDPAAVDDVCRRAWEERRARFFGQPEAQP